MMTELLMIWSNQLGISLAIWAMIAIFVLYLARQPAHQLLHALGHSLNALTRIAARSIAKLEQHLITRNRDVIIQEAKEVTERAIEREFSRVNAIVARDLAAYPRLHRKITDAIHKIETDYHAATDAPPIPPAWSEVVDTIASLPPTNDATVAKILNNIESAVKETHAETLKHYQESSNKRHKLLGQMQPQWRELNQSMEGVKQTIDGMEDRTQLIDRQMEKYGEIRRGEDQAVRSLTSSSLTQFFISGLVLLVAMLGGLINFQLIAVPMSEMVGGTSYIGSMRTSDIAALVIILIEIAMGLFLLESLRITRLFPVISSMDDKMRKRMVWITLTILTVLAGIEASLAYMRDLLALDKEALQQSLAGVGVVHAQFRWIPSIGQMVMGFILPFALAFIAIPLESFIHSLRTVLGMLGVSVLRGVYVLLRLLGSLAKSISKLLINAYDMVIMIPLSIEQFVVSQRKQREQRRQQVEQEKESYIHHIDEYKVPDINDNPF